MKSGLGAGQVSCLKERGRASALCHPNNGFTHRTYGISRKRMRTISGGLLLPFLVAVFATAMPRNDLTVDQLKAKVPSASVPDKVHLCVQIAEKQLDVTTNLYATGEIEKAQPMLSDVVSFSELARDYSIQSKKHQKQTEISVRTMTRKLNDILHLLGQADQPPVRDAISRLERVRDDLLTSMFSKGAK